MTEKEAIEIIKYVPLYRYECELEKHRQSDLFQALCMAVDALEKQTMVNEILNELKEYTVAEEQGLLVRVECRCKDCVHWSDMVAGATDHVKLCTIGGYMVGKNGYCLYGEKKLKGEEHEKYRIY